MPQNWAAEMQAVRLGAPPTPDGPGLLEEAWEHTPEGETREGIKRAGSIPRETPVAEVVEVLGNGREILCQDTVPFALWCAAMNAGNYAQALWTAASGGGDVDTICAITGSVVVLSAGQHSIPGDWLSATEKLPQ